MKYQKVDLKTDIRNINAEELQNYINSQKQPRFRTGQVLEWIWKKGIVNFSEMKNLPSGFRQKLEKDFEFRPATESEIQVSDDGTQKVLFSLFDGNFIEGVVIPQSDRVTACISTQVGCPLKCSFCATGQYGYKRNLDAAEITDQFNILNRLSVRSSGRPLSNIVLMGMGDPFLNLDNVLKAMMVISSPDFLNFSASRITFSTIGIPEKIYEVTRLGFPYKLALSLHSSITDVRTRLIPSSSKYPLEDIRNALVMFAKRYKKPVTVEFLLLKGINTSKQEADSLVKFCSGFSSKINLIIYNEVPGLPYMRPEDGEVAQFLAYLKRKNVVVTVRKSMGNDISAACGQLANKFRLVK